MKTEPLAAGTGARRERCEEARQGARRGGGARGGWGALWHAGGRTHRLQLRCLCCEQLLAIELGLLACRLLRGLHLQAGLSELRLELARERLTLRSRAHHVGDFLALLAIRRDELLELH